MGKRESERRETKKINIFNLIKIEYIYIYIFIIVYNNHDMYYIDRLVFAA
jgi:hypothetical protein